MKRIEMLIGATALGLVSLSAAGVPLELVPYGCAKLRFSALAIQAKGDGCR